MLSEVELDTYGPNHLTVQPWQSFNRVHFMYCDLLMNKSQYIKCLKFTDFIHFDIVCHKQILENRN